LRSIKHLYSGEWYRVTRRGVRKQSHWKGKIQERDLPRQREALCPQARRSEWQESPACCVSPRRFDISERQTSMIATGVASPERDWKMSDIASSFKSTNDSHSDDCDWGQCCFIRGIRHCRRARRLTGEEKKDTLLMLSDLSFSDKDMA